MLVKTNRIFSILMYQIAAALQISIANLAAILKILENSEINITFDEKNP